MTDTAAPSPPTSLSVVREPFIFTGTAREYFGIWIVNVMLTILTLGIYSAWAKVRRQRYFYGNTFLAGSSFDYHARPKQILIGRIIVLALLAVYNVTLQVVPIVGGVIFVALVFVVPWLIMRGLRFSARVTSYRNVRFDFTGGYGGAFQAFILGGALVYGTAGVLAPLASQWMWSYMLGNLRYGDRPITCDPRLERMYGQWWLPAFVLIGGIIGIAALAGAILAFNAGTLSNLFSKSETFGTNSTYLIIGLIYAAFIPFIILYLIAGLLYRAGTRNVALNETVIDGRHVLASSIGRWRFAWISVSNLVLTILTIGLARPWAAIRMARYMALVTALDTTGSLDAYLSTVRSEGAAVGSEFMDVEGFDVGF
jgi:uncharacterized membrane protein YjgN (DUF898 family)